MYTTENCDFKARGIAWLCTDPPSERGSIERLMKHTTCQVNKSNANYGCKEAADKYCTSSIPYCTVFIWPTRVQILEYELRIQKLFAYSVPHVFQTAAASSFEILAVLFLQMKPDEK